MRSRDRIALSWIDPGTVDGGFAVSMINLYAARQSRIGTLIRVQGGGLLSRQRNEVVASFLNQTDLDWLLMIDSDETLSVEAFDKLIGAAHEDLRPVVAGLVFAAWPNGGLYPDPIPAIYGNAAGGQFAPIHQYPPDKVIKIAAAGTGCLLVHRTVFDAIREGASEHEGKDWCWFHDMPVNGAWFSEDLFFCRRVTSLGFPIVAHTGVVLPHHKTYWLTDAHHRKARADAT